MSYSASSPPRPAPSDRRPRLSPSESAPLSSRLHALLVAVEIPDCGCPLVLVPVCQRIVRLRPELVLAGGCERRAHGRRCDCARWPGPACEHVAGLAARQRISTALVNLARYCRAAVDPVDCWAYLLWLSQRERYRDRPEAAAGVRALTRSSRVALRQLRRQLRLSLWRDDDVLVLGETATDSEVEQQSRAAVDRRRLEKRLEKQRLSFLAALARSELGKGGRHGDSAA